MISPHKRSALEAQFEGLSIAKTFYKTVNLPKILRDTIRAKLNSKAKLTLKIDPNYDYYRFTPDPDDVFSESVKYLNEIQRLVVDLKDQDITYEDHLIESMSMMIFTSNSLENAGSSHLITLRLCKDIFAGREVPENVKERNPEEYQAMVEHLRSKMASENDDAVIRSRRQIIQHAYALKYITYRTVVKGEALSEDILKETHKILTEGIDAENKEKDKSDTYGGIYRNESVGWFTAFLDPKNIPDRMAQTVAAFNDAVQEGESKQCIDPYQLASKYFHKILNIHPFLDGNSRLCRLLLNTVILKYAGIMIPIGRDSIETAKFKETITRAVEIETADKEDRGSKPAWAEVATFVAIQGRSTLRALKESLMAGKRGELFKRRKSIVGYYWETLADDEEKEDGEGIEA